MFPPNVEVEILIPLLVIPASLHSLCRLRCRPVSHRDINFSLPPEVGLETWKVTRSDDWRGNEI
jgi:hypothetical protein